LLQAHAENRRLWNKSFTYSITFHSVGRNLRLKPASEPKDLRAEREMLE